MPRVIKSVTYNSRAISFRGRVVFASMGKYVTDFLAPFRRPGWTIESGDEDGPIDESREMPVAALSSVLCHTDDSGLGSDPQTADKVAAFLVAHYRVSPR